MGEHAPPRTHPYTHHSLAPVKSLKLMRLSPLQGLGQDLLIFMHY